MWVYMVGITLVAGHTGSRYTSLQIKCFNINIEKLSNYKNKSNKINVNQIVSKKIIISDVSAADFTLFCLWLDSLISKKLVKIIKEKTHPTKKNKVFFIIFD